jgi:type VI secretion system secreted protein Hcp
MAVDMFIKIGEIKGEAQDGTYKGADGWIDVLAWSWGASNSGTTHILSGSGSGKASFQDISLTKYIDAASPDLMKSTAKGTHHPEAKLIIRKAGDTPLDYLTYTLKDVIITSISTGGSGGEDRLTENVTLNFGAFEMVYNTQAADGTKVDGTPLKWDIAANAEM